MYDTRDANEEMNTTTLDAQTVTKEELDVLDDAAARIEAAASAEDSGLASLLRQLSAMVKNGTDVELSDLDSEVSPARCAEILRMSRTHIYKLLKSGEIPSHNVGRDHRVSMRDVIQFGMKREQARRELAERFAHSQSQRSALVDEIAASL